MIQQRYILVAILAFVFGFGLEAQDESPFPKGKKGYEQVYKRNIKKSRINGVYIPADLDEAFSELDALSPPDAVAKFARAPEDVVASKLHFGLGTWIKVNWNFIEGSRYVEHLRGLGLTDHDHMVQFTIVSYHRFKNGKPLEVEAQVKAYQAKRQEYLDQLNGRTTTISTQTKKIKKG